MSLSRWNKLAGVAAFIAAAAGSAHATRPEPGSVTIERLKLPSGPNSVRGLAGEPAVDPFWAKVDYQVPIELPAGYGGLAPALALSYSGLVGNGPLGIGWSLTAQGAIQRSTRLGVPRFDDALDTFELTGIADGRLVPIGGGGYRVEGLGQTVRVVRSGAGFEVDDGQGNHYKLGLTAAGRQASADGTRTAAWLVEEVTNPQGERIRYEYLRDQGQIYPSKVIWGAGDAYAAELIYVARPDQTRSYRAGFSVVTARKLDRIVVKAFSPELGALAVRRTYQMTYDTSFPLARLSKVSSTGVAGAGAWPELVLDYAPSQAPVKTAIAGIGSWRLSTTTTLVDLDADGAADLVQLVSGNHKYLLSHAGAFIGPPLPLTGNSQALSAVQLQDIDGDARADLLQDTGAGWAVYKYKNGVWLSQAATLPGGVWPGTAGLQLKPPPSTAATTRFGDLNGDGLVDAMQWNSDHLLVHMATREALGPTVVQPRIGGAAIPDDKGRFQDVNGDGLDDYVVTATTRLDVYLGHGDGTFDAVRQVAYPFTGTVTSPEEIELSDLDRDGLVDLLQIGTGTGTVGWFRGKPDGTFATAPVTLTSPETMTSAVTVAVADLNGNGSHDVVWSSASGMWSLDMAGTTTAGMLVRVRNGLGLDVAIDYQSSHVLSSTAADAGDAWTSVVPIAMPVPVQKRTSLGAGETTRKIDYVVRNGLWDDAEQRFAGFMTTKVITWGATTAETSVVTTSYHNGLGASPNNRVLRGKVVNRQVRNGSNIRLSLTTNTWSTQTVTGLPDTPLARRAILLDTKTKYEDVSPARETKVVYSYDGLGRPSHVVDSGRTDRTDDDSVTDTTYADDNTTWIRDRVCERKVSSVGDVLAERVQTLYGDDQVELGPCLVGKGWVRRTRGWLGGENRWVTRTETAYDAHGNPTSVKTGGVERRFQYDADGRFVREERVTAPDRDLVWTATWDPVLGVMKTLTDPDGHVSALSYDELGRYTGVGLDGGERHQVIEYDWTGAFPLTTVWDFDGERSAVIARPASWTAGVPWRQSVQIANGLGETRYTARRLAASQWIIEGYRERDPASRVVFAGRPVVSSQLVQTARPAGIAGDSLAYDPLGRLIEQTSPTGAKRTYSYLAFERTITEADLMPVHSVLDGAGRPIQTERTLPGGAHEVIDAVYDPAGRLTQMTLAGGAVVREFTYDTLGRLTRSRDPDLGVRELEYDDGDRLRRETNAAGQAIVYSYDGLGRVITRDLGGAAVYHFHYDTARAGVTGFGNLSGRLSFVEEPTGTVDVGYDELGRPVRSRRTIDGHVSEATTRLSASGLTLGKTYDDGFAVSFTYDPAARVTGATDLWSVLQLDPAGQPLHERTATGVDTVYDRDVLGLPRRVTITDANGAVIYDATAERTAWNALKKLTDTDHVGLDHSAQFGYDGFARLTSATIAGRTFGYQYDVLHNMTSRTSTPTGIGQFTGSYRYENTLAPRQLTSIADGSGTPLHTFSYDPAGRQTTQDALALSYDSSDRLLRVDGLPAGSVVHAYGHDGARLKTVSPGGAVSYFFGDGTAERGGVREHDVAVGDRVIARVRMEAGAAVLVGPDEPAAGVTGSPAWRGLGLAALALVTLGLALLAIRAAPRGRRAGSSSAEATAVSTIRLAARTPALGYAAHPSAARTIGASTCVPGDPRAGARTLRVRREGRPRPAGRRGRSALRRDRGWSG